MEPHWDRESDPKDGAVSLGNPAQGGRDPTRGYDHGGHNRDFNPKEGGSTLGSPSPRSMEPHWEFGPKGGEASLGNLIPRGGGGVKHLLHIEMQILLHVCMLTYCTCALCRHEDFLTCLHANVFILLFFMPGGGGEETQHKIGTRRGERGTLNQHHNDMLPAFLLDQGDAGGGGGLNTKFSNGGGVHG